jgi:hypothetical protein
MHSISGRSLPTFFVNKVFFGKVNKMIYRNYFLNHFMNADLYKIAFINGDVLKNCKYNFGTVLITFLPATICVIRNNLLLLFFCLVYLQNLDIYCN